jgi:glycosyltransferase involved in cell wall biosynthesis
VLLDFNNRDGDGLSRRDSPGSLLTGATKPAGRYVFISPWPVKSGAGVNNVILGLRDAMADRYDPIIVVTSWCAASDGQIPIRLREPERSLRSLVGFAICFFRDLIQLHSLVRGAVAVNPHYVAGLHLLPLAILRKLRLAPKLIFSVHNSDVATILASSRVRRAFFRWLYSTADVVVACSKALAQKVLEIDPGANVVFVWNAVHAPAKISEARPLPTCYLVCTAAFIQSKGHDLLLEAFADISQIHPSLDLVLIGASGGQLDAVRSMVESHRLAQRVHFLVDLPHEQVWLWVKHAECLVLPSRREGFALCILEAGAVGTPVVATRVGGAAELLGDDERGVLCEPENSKSLAAAILKTLSDKDCAKERADALYQVVSKLTWADAFEKYRAAGGLP